MSIPILSYILLLISTLSHTGSGKPSDLTHQTKITVSALAMDVVTVLKEQDIPALAALTHPEKGIRFSPYGFVGEADRVLLRDELDKQWKSKTRVFWGLLDATGRPIRRTFKEYYKRFIYDRDFASTKRVTINDVQRTNKYTNVFEVYPNGVVVEYYFSGDRDFEELDWRSLRLVFEEFEEVWYLCGIIHDEWTQSSTD
jgi:hypothetical protein